MLEQCTYSTDCISRPCKEFVKSYTNTTMYHQCFQQDATWCWLQASAKMRLGLLDGTLSVCLGHYWGFEIMPHLPLKNLGNHKRICLDWKFFMTCVGDDGLTIEKISNALYRYGGLPMTAHDWLSKVYCKGWVPLNSQYEDLCAGLSPC